MAYLKKDAPADVLETLRQAEARADECWRALQILEQPSNVAISALLAGGIRIVDREQAARGSNTPYFDAMLANVCRSLAVAVKWAVRHGQPVSAPLRLVWTDELAAVDQALSLATHYSHFEVCFQAFHKDRYAAEVIAPALVRFTAPGTERDRVLRSCRRTGPSSFECDDPWDRWRELLPEYSDRVKALARRADTLSLGDYTSDLVGRATLRRRLSEARTFSGPAASRAFSIGSRRVDGSWPSRPGS